MTEYIKYALILITFFVIGGCVDTHKYDEETKMYGAASLIYRLANDYNYFCVFKLVDGNIDANQRATYCFPDNQSPDNTKTLSQYCSGKLESIVLACQSFNWALYTTTQGDAGAFQMRDRCGKANTMFEISKECK